MNMNQLTKVPNVMLKDGVFSVAVFSDLANLNSDDFEIDDVIQTTFLPFNYTVASDTDASAHLIYDNIRLYVVEGPSGHDLRAWGCVENEDCTTQFQLLANSKTNGFPSNVHVPAGYWRISDSIPWFPRQMFGGVGHSSNIVSTIVGKPVFAWGGERGGNNNVHDLRIVGSGLETYGWEFPIGYEGFNMSDVVFISVGGSALYLKKTFAMTFTNVWCQGNGITMYPLEVDEITNTVFTGCKFREANRLGAGALLHRSYNLKFDNCLFEANEGDGIHISRLSTCAFVDCYWEANNFSRDGGDFSHVRFINRDGASDGSTGVTFERPYFNPNYVKHLITGDRLCSNLRVEDPLIQNWGTVPENDTFEYAPEPATLAAPAYYVGITPNSVKQVGDSQTYCVFDGLITADQSPVKIGYTSTTGGAIDGYFTLTAEETRTYHSGVLKTVSFEVSWDSADWASWPTSRQIAIELPFGSTSAVKQSSGFITHFGTSGTGVLGFFLEQRANNKNLWLLKKQRITDSGSNTAFTQDLENVFKLQGSIVYA